MVRRARAACALPTAVAENGEQRGRWWLIASFVFCPCHLPVTLSVLASLGGASALGALVRGHEVAVGIVVSLVWLAGTARGLLLIRHAQRAADAALALAPAAPGSPSLTRR